MAIHKGLLANLFVRNKDSELRIDQGPVNVVSRLHYDIDIFALTDMC